MNNVKAKTLEINNFNHSRYITQMYHKRILSSITKRFGYSLKTKKIQPKPDVTIFQSLIFGSYKNK